MNRIAILVLGMHRSGTSALTWLIGRMGAQLPADAIQPSDENARGYWESASLVAADDQLLRVARSSWFDLRPLDLSRLSADAVASRRRKIREALAHAFGEASLFVIKDPRQCRFVPTMSQVLTEMDTQARVVLMLRNASDIAASLARRDGTTPAYAHALWLRHMIDAERGSRGMVRAVVDYDAMLADWRSTVGRLIPLIGIGDGLFDAEEAATIDAFIDPSLRHHHLAESPLDVPLADIVAEVEERLRALTACDDAAAHERLEETYHRFETLDWLEAEIIHDELRHRRMPRELETSPPPPMPDPTEVPKMPEPALVSAADPTGDAALIRASGLFDEDWYRAHYGDVPADMDPVDHYLAIGAAEGRNPSPLFDTGYYARQMARRQAGRSGSMM